MRTWIIYKHTLKVDGPQKGWSYIGQTCTSLEKRARQGNGYLGNQRDAAFGKAILQYGWNNFEHEILEDGIDSKALANERERFWIFYFKTYIGNLECQGFNSTKGGDSWGTYGKIKIYNCKTEESMFIAASDLPDYEKIGWEKWYTPERKQQLRRQYYLTHIEYELSLTTKNQRKRTAEKAALRSQPAFSVSISREDFDSEEAYKKAYNKEYGKLYRAAHKEKLNKQSSEWQRLNKERANKYANDYYYRKSLKHNYD